MLLVPSEPHSILVILVNFPKNLENLHNFISFLLRFWKYFTFNYDKQHNLNPQNDECRTCDKVEKMFKVTRGQDVA